jgi:hypothetical protein
MESALQEFEESALTTYVYLKPIDVKIFHLDTDLIKSKWTAIYTSKN